MTNSTALLFYCIDRKRQQILNMQSIQNDSKNSISEIIAASRHEQELDYEIIQLEQNLLLPLADELQTREKEDSPENDIITEEEPAPPPIPS